MKNLVVANHQPGARTSEQHLRTLIDAQLANSLALGWAPADLIVVTNLQVDAPARIVQAPLNEYCLTGSKMFALHHLFAAGVIAPDEVWWAHDLDAWQNHWFEPPPFADIGLAEYSRPKFNGGSVFLRHTARDLVGAVVAAIESERGLKEEPAINRLLRARSLRGRVTVLDPTFNVGCSGYGPRHERSAKPILVSHFHPHRKSAWRIHVEGDNPIGLPSVSPRLAALLAERFRR